MTGTTHFEFRGHRVTVAARTDVGKVRHVNEDNYCVSPRVWAVSDGMGGHQAGDVAAEIVVETCAAVGNRDRVSVADVGRMITDANDAVRASALEHGCAGMGATLTGVALCDNGGETSLVLFNVGDSRCYELADGGPLCQLSLDHSLVQEMVDAGQISAGQAAVHPRRNVITRAVGIDKQIRPDLEVLATRDRRLMMCTDGVSGELAHARMEAILQSPFDASTAAADLIGAALEGTAPDNATALVVDVESSGPTAVPSATSNRSLDVEVTRRVDETIRTTKRG